jgi:ribonuclease HI
MVVKQLRGEYKIKSQRIIPLYRQVLLLQSRFPDGVEIRWVPREENKEADSLTNRAYNKALQDNPEYLDRALRK